MAIELLELIPLALKRHQIKYLDLTGGAPELHPGFRQLVLQARTAGVAVIDRCNLTILSEPGQENLADFLAEHNVTIMASLPCHTAGNVDRQRGSGVFERSISGLRQLNSLGYGDGDPLRSLNLVYNPPGATLPAPQAALEADYKRELARFGIRFDRLLTLVNMPIQRFARQLELSDSLEEYWRVLEKAYNPANLEAVMCRHLLSIDWEGWLYDCDFNQQLSLPRPGLIRHLRDLVNSDADFSDDPIHTGRHCFGCTAGSGSSCGGALQV
ncbi:arsenosugar biosynthesis radical SAM protein ArsS [Synechococcus sp. M16CYN]